MSANNRDIADVTGEPVQDNDYVSRTGQKEAMVPVQSDNDLVDDPKDGATADSDAQLEKDEADAINKGNIINERTRGAAKSGGTYREPGDEEGLPSAADGTSSGRQ